VRTSLEDRLGGPDAIVTALAVVAAAVAYTVVNRSLVIVAARQIYPGVKLPIIGSWDDNALELATLCLGAMTGIVLLHQPWVSVLVLLPMVLLQRGALVKDLEQAASTDAKTGLLNATVWQGAARRELARVDRDKATAAVLILDLDHFKSVNDDHGHLFGDAALVTVGARLKAELRQYDVLGRFGGEEFVVMLPRVSYAEATAAAERLRAAIASIAYDEFAGTMLEADSPARARSLSVSVGVALYPDHGADVEELLLKADAALYVAKRTGRNRVTVATDADPAN
jgi:diguanylate cyclase (GGDEF)-like protein